MRKIRTYTALLLGLTLLGACNSNDDVLSNEFNGEITIDGDVECCSVEEARIIYNFLKKVKEVPALGDTIDGTYRLSAYTYDGTFHTGYNDIWFVVTKLKNANYVKEYTLGNITPLMTMQMASGMTMRHSTPVGGDAAAEADVPQALKHTWISFLMATSDAGKWEVDYSLDILGRGAQEIHKTPDVESLPSGQAWLKSFKTAGGDTYYLSLVSPDHWQTGSNAIRAYVSKKSSPATDPYLLSKEEFTIGIDPRMPDMGNHTSPDNTPLTLQDDESYLGTVNLTMTGLWRIYLTVSDSQGNIIAGGDDSLWWDVTI